jgi:hypothetical protein
MTAGPRQASAVPDGQSSTVYKQEQSGNLSNPSGLNHGGTPLTLREARSFIFVRVNSAKLFPIGVKDTHQVMVMLAAAIFAESSLASNARFFRVSFYHVGHPIQKNKSNTISAARAPHKYQRR